VKSFRLEKTSGDADVTKEALMWLVVLLVVVAPLLYLVYSILG
jgi:hypothetical protein